MPRCRDQQLYFRTDFPLLVYLGYKRWRCLESYKYNIRYRFYRFTSSSITKPSDFTSLVWCWETRKWNEKNLSMLSARRKPSNICRMNSITCYPRRTYYNIIDGTWILLARAKRAPPCRPFAKPKGSLTAPPPVPQSARRERAAALQPEPLRTVFVYL